MNGCFKSSAQWHLSRQREPEYQEACSSRSGARASLLSRRAATIFHVSYGGEIEAAEDHSLLFAAALNFTRMIRSLY